VNVVTSGDCTAIVFDRIWMARHSSHQAARPSRSVQGPPTELLASGSRCSTMTALTPTRRVVTFDFLGWGASDKPASYRPTARNQLREVETVIDELGLEDPVLVAHDASGPPGIDWALLHPDRLGRSCCSTPTTSGRRASDGPERSRCTPHRW
jgi:pimeloyl-ACP methyl ester carboxylesterase